MIQIIYANSADFQQKINFKDLLLNLPQSMHERAKRYHFPQDAFNYSLGRLLLKNAIHNLGLPPESINKIHYNNYEKPLINGMSFSISHSKHLVACAFANSGAIGLDLEFPRDIDKNYFRHCFNEEEWSAILKDSSMDTFYTYWTQKEAILKAEGVGLDRLQDINIKNRTATIKGSSHNFYLNNLSFKNENVFGCLCTDGLVDFNINSFEVKDLSNL